VVLLYFAIVGLVISFAGKPLLRPLRDPRLCYIGTISYGLYFYHLPLNALISPSHYYPNCNDSMALDATKVAATFALAVASWEFFEKPVLRLKDRFPYPAPEKGDTNPEVHIDSAQPRPHLLPRPGTVYPVRDSDRLTSTRHESLPCSEVSRSRTRRV
jgi:peptidoglycan/LPS O-acetylase OafA/YrhL